MYYLELIERFWIFNQKAKPGSTAIAMYLYLLKTGKENDAYDFKVSDVVLSKELGLTRQTVKSTKEKLQDFGLIQFQTQNGVSGSYRLILNYPLEVSAPEKRKNAKTEVIPTFQRSNDDKDLLLIGARVKRPSGNEDNEIKPSSPQLSNENIKIPEFEQFVAYAQTLATYQPELDELITVKYKSWKKNGWKNSSDRLITNWRSTLKSTMPFLKNDAKDNQLSLQSIPDIKRPK
ncbi:hypothetical protein HZQ13_05605 [Elizabethkingia anophelis]|nr:hypothetical protein [Elizabethkingia anophelis]